MQTISLHFHFKSSASAKGAKGEIAVCKALRFEGIPAKRVRLSGHDIEIIQPSTGEKILLEVKTITRGKDGKYRATTIKKNSQDCRKSDYIVLLCQLPERGGQCAVYVIPTAFVGNTSHVVITSHPDTYQGKYNQFRNAWSSIV